MNRASFTHEAAAPLLSGLNNEPLGLAQARRCPAACPNSPSDHRRFSRPLMASVAVMAMAGAVASDAAAQTCNQTSTPFQAAYNQQIPTGTDKVFMDVVTHRYTFKPLVNMTMCSIGYQSPPLASTQLAYRFKLFDMTTTPPTLMHATQALNGLIKFPAAPPFTTSHYSIPPQTLVAGRTYQLRRTAVSYASSNDLVGRVLTDQAPEFTIVAPNIKIPHSKLYGGGGPFVDQYLPHIDFGFY